jgi:hypothetical protein
MNEDELNKIVETRLAERLAARVAAERERVREEVILALRREAERAHHAKINARHPIENQFSGLTREQHEERLRLMDERRAAESARLDKINARPVPGQVVRGLRPRAVDGAGGSVGFKIR